VDYGQLNLKKKLFATDERKIDDACTCYTCKTYDRAFLHLLNTSDEVTVCSLISIHNVAYQMRLMQRVRDAIKEDRFPEFATNFIRNYYSPTVAAAIARNGEVTAEAENSLNRRNGEVSSNKFNIPDWIVNALNAVNINVLTE
jgi:hypothetical protein